MTAEKVKHFMKLKDVYASNTRSPQTGRNKRRNGRNKFKTIVENFYIPLSVLDRQKNLEEYRRLERLYHPPDWHTQKTPHKPRRSTVFSSRHGVFANTDNHICQYYNIGRHSICQYINHTTLSINLKDWNHAKCIIQQRN